MTTTLEIARPVELVFEQWTRFEEFPTFMSDVDAITELDESHHRWTARVGEDRRQWLTEVSDLVPLRHLSWRATGGGHGGGEVSFYRLRENRTLVALDPDPDPRDNELIGGRQGSSQQARDDLRAFKDYIEDLPRLRRPRHPPSWIPPSFTTGPFAEPATAACPEADRRGRRRLARRPAPISRSIERHAIEILRAAERPAAVACDVCFSVAQFVLGAVTLVVHPHRRRC